MTEWVCGCEPDPPDPRDLGIALLGLPTTPPPATDWKRARELVRAILYQGQEPSCVGYAIAGAVRTSIALDGLPDFVPSPRAPWFWARASQGREAVYGGTNIRAAMKAIMALGLPPEHLYDRMVPFDQAPSFAAVRAAAKYRGLRGYYRADGMDEIKRALAAWKPVVFGMDVRESFQRYDGRTTLRRDTGKLLGGHAMYLIAYEHGRMLGVNSYGRSWGDDGFFWVDEERIAGDARDTWAADLHPEVWKPV